MPESTESVEFFIRLSAILRKKGDLIEAERVLTKAISLFSTNPYLYLNRGGIRLLLGKKDEAKSDFLTALKLKSDLEEAKANLKLIE
ncbi:MAG TPA: hypothetical protein PLJ44_11935 [Victivallales bacterium]|nr:hypothetical protein [Victivallales bacterium]